jgi:uncharacterized protein (DUF433 family)
MSLHIAADPVPLYLAEEGRIVRVEGSRVSLDTIVGGYLLGWPPEEIAASYPTVSLAKVHAVIAYYLAHKDDVDAYLAENRRRSDALRREIEADPEYRARRERLLAARRADEGRAS